MRGHAGYAAEVVAVVYAIAAVVFFPTWTVDDAYIGFRYARNLAEHGQLTWNPGSRPVEGYTGIALVLLVAAGMKLGLSPVAVSQAVGLASFAAGAIVLSRFLRRLEVLNGIRIAALVLYVGAPFFLTNSRSGLETVLFSTVTLASVFALYVCAASPVASATSVAALCALLLVDGLVRPEGALLGGASLIGLAIARRHDPASRRRAHLALALLIYVLPGAVYFGWRWSYYGLLLPNTFWAKTHGGELLGLSVEWGTVDDIRGFIAGYLMLPLAAAILWLVPEADGARAALRRDGRAA